MRMSKKIVAFLLALVMTFSTLFVSMDTKAVAADITISDAAKATKNLMSQHSCVIKDLLKTIPGLSALTLDSLWDFTSMLLNGVIEDPKSTVEDTLARIEQTMNTISQQQQLSDNKSFNEIANEILIFNKRSFKVAKRIVENKEDLEKDTTELKNLNKQLEELIKKEQAAGPAATPSDERKELQEKINKLTDAIESQKSTIAEDENGYINLLTNSQEATALMNNLEKIQLYISDSGIGQEKNPFLNYYNSKCKELGFSHDALSVSNKYENDVFSVYTTGVFMYAAALYVQLNVTTNETKRNNLNKMIDGIFDDFEKTLDAYKDIVAKENENCLDYYYDGNHHITIGGVATAAASGFIPGTMDGLILHCTGDVSCQSLIMTMAAKQTSAKYDEYMNIINKMIQDNYTESNAIRKNLSQYNDTLEKGSDADPDEKVTLRTFLKYKGFNIPDESKYLLAGKMTTPWNGSTINTDIPLYELDSCDAKIITPQVVSPMPAPFIGAVEHPYSEICYLYDVSDNGTSKDEIAADVITNGNVVHYKDIVAAWNAAARIYYTSEVNVTVKLYKDWNAVKQADGNNYMGKGFGFLFGSIYIDNDQVSDTYRKKNTITLDLNGRTIDRGLTKPTLNGSVICLNRQARLNITDSCGTTKGTIKGGYAGDYSSESVSKDEYGRTPYTDGIGGGILCNYGEYSSLNITNVIICDNKAEKSGGGIGLIRAGASGEQYDTVTMLNCTFTNNSAGEQGGGVYTESEAVFSTDFSVGGETIIIGNKVNGAENNVYLAECWFTKATLKILKEDPLYGNAKIGINSPTNDNWLKIVEKSDRDFSSYFCYDTSKYRIENDGSGSSQKINIVKN